MLCTENVAQVVHNLELTDRTQVVRRQLTERTKVVQTVND